MANELLRLDNIGIVVASLDSAIEFFVELGMSLEGRTLVEGEWAGRLTGLHGQVVEIAMLRTPDGNSRIELSKFIHPVGDEDHSFGAVNALGYLRAMFTVTDINELVQRLTQIGAKVEGDIVDYHMQYRLCYVRSREGILVGLAQPL